MKTLPYTARTTSGDIYEFDLPLHEETNDPVRVGQLLTVVLDSLDKEIKITGDISDGDLLQAMAMALAVRVKITNAPFHMIEDLARELLDQFLRASSAAERSRENVGHA